MRIFEELGKVKHLSVNCETVQKLIKHLQNFITDNYYTCTDELFKELGKMYAADERFKNNINKAGGVGTAEFTAKAIEAMM